MIKANSSYTIRTCVEGVPGLHKECTFNLGINRESNKASSVKVQFRLNELSLSSAATTVAELSEREVKNAKKVRRNDGDILLFGDRGPIVIAVKQGRNLSSRELIMEFDHSHPLHYIDKSIRVKKVSAICAFYDIANGGWDASVCKNPPNISNTTITCACDHNSAFAVMFAVTNITLDSTLSTACFVFEGASIVALLATSTFLIVYRRKLRNFDRVLVQISLCISLAMAHLFMLLSDIAISNDTFCHAVIVITLYFLVSTSVLMVMEGGIMLIKVLCKSFHNADVIFVVETYIR